VRIHYSRHVTKTVAGAILDILWKAGVRETFGIPGVHNLAFWNALSANRPSIRSVRHEQTTVYAADGLARSTGGLGVAFTTTGPGAANTLGAFGEAAVSNSAILVISSEAPMKLRKPDLSRGLLHEMTDQSSLFSPLAKKDDAGRALAISAVTGQGAIKAAQNLVIELMKAPKGSGYLGIPADVLNQEIDIELNDVEFAQKVESLDLSNEIKELVSRSNKVSIWAGGGAIDFSEEIRKLSDHLSAPIFTSFAGRGIGSSSQNYLQFPIHENEVSQLMSESDVLLVFGSELDGMNTKNWTIPWPTKIVIFDIRPGKATLNCAAQYQFETSDIASVIQQLCELPSKNAWTDIAKLNLEVRNRLRNSDKERSGTSLVEAVDNAWKQVDPVFCDMAVSGYWVGVYGKNERPRRTAYPVGWGTLGFALPAAIGAAAAGMKPLVICGDGGFAFAMSELATIAQEKLPITILLNDDGGYGMLRFDQQVMNHKEQGVDLFNPDWKTLCESFQIFFKESDLANLEKNLKEQYAKNQPGLLLLREKFYPPRSTSPRWREA
jgi:thiamine pyrophosphate-dependent acetolactate synthase large subunit-like protein